MTDVQTRFDHALETLISKVQTDRCVLAAVLLGSLAHDTVWQRSDIDLLLVVEETKIKKEGLSLVESGVNIHAMLTTRSEFRKILEGSVQGSFMHSLLVKGRLLFSRDEPLKELFEQRNNLGERDRAIQLLQRVQYALAGLAKAEKWLYVRGDATYCAFWILKCVDALASIEVLLNGGVPAREVVQQAIQTNPSLFGLIYTELIEQSPSLERVQESIDAINAYIKQNGELIFEPILSYLEEEGAMRSMSDLNHYFGRQYSVSNVDIACEWLADEGYLDKMALPVRITNRSQVNVEEAAYSYRERESR
ncbi:MAG TPA: nucleotidyltransferase domain-containing protein [Fimbriimonas sp.]|nr:nucleotidyltransferase domain-containing protein [Fimbriimonas sp.]